MIALWFCANYFLGNFLPQTRINKKWGIAFAAIAGFSSHIAHAGGPPVRGFLLNQKLDKTAFVATFSFFFAWVNIFKLIAYLTFNQINMQTLIISFYLVLIAPFGIIVGIILHQKKVPQELFIKIAYFMLAMVAIKLTHDGTCALISCIIYN